MALAGVPKRGCSFRMQGKERAGLSHGIADARCSHGDGRDASTNAHQHTGRENAGACCAKEHAAELRDKSGVRRYSIDGQNSEERSADKQIDSGDERDAADKCNGQVRLGLRISPAILLASHQPPKLKKALMTPPAIAGKSGSEPGGVR